jgi:RNA polymerase sigma-70 factor (ECF subfamily)
MRATIAEPLPEDLSVPDDGNAVISTLLIDQLLGSLKPAQAAAIRLVKLQGRSIADAAALTGQTRALVKVNIHRGLAKLAAQVDGFAHAS